MAIKIVWLNGTGSSRKERATITAWIRSHGDEVRELYHYADGHEIEAVKILWGDQETRPEKVTIQTLELKFMKNLALVLKAVESQVPGSFAMSRTETQLGYLGGLCGGDDWADAELTTKEIK